MSRSAFTRAWVQWLLLVALTGALLVVLIAAHAPAAALLGPLAAGIVFGVGGAKVRPPAAARTVAYTVIGCLVALSLGKALGPALYLRLPLFGGIGLTTLGLCLGLGWLLARLGWFGGATAVWGLAPGNSATMVALAEESGADARLVAVMQYFRILIVTGAAIALAHLVVGGGTHGPSPGIRWLPPLEPLGLAQAAGLCAAGVAVARLTRFSPGLFLVPGLLGAVLIAAGLIRPQVPPLLTLAAYTVVGWGIGLGFTPDSLRRSAFALPKVIVATVALVTLCLLCGVLVSVLLRVSLLTGILATAPGGMDTILIIGATSPVDLPFILAVQVMRIIMILAVGPALVGWIARRSTQ